jgi:hypothetical protein
MLQVSEFDVDAIPPSKARLNISVYAPEDSERDLTVLAALEIFEFSRDPMA